MTGVGTYIHNLCTALIRKFPDEQYVLFSSSFKDRLDTSRYPRGNVTFSDRHFPVKLLDTAFNKIHFPPLQFFTGGFDLFHSPSPVLPPLMKCARIITVHDLFFLKEPGNSQRLSRTVFARQIEQNLAKADAVICVSHFTAGEVKRYFSVDESRLRVIHHGSDHIAESGKKSDEDYVKTAKNEFFEKHKLLKAERLILFVGTIEPRKNPGLLLESFEKLLEMPGIDANLVYAGGVGWGVEEFIDRLGRSQHRSRIFITGYQSRGDLNSIYEAADLLVMPSKEEGFGLPIIEAMKLGVPVIAADNSSMPEIGGNAALYFKTGSAEELAGLLKKTLSDTGLRRQMIDKGKARAKEFTWDKAAAATMAIYKEAAAKK